jgi:Fe-Mn family superoxide dismutase
MKSNKKVDLTEVLKKIDIEDIVKTSLEGAAPELMSEAYVSEPKTFKQVSEFVSQKTKDFHTKIYNDYVGGLNEVSSELDTAPRALEKVNSYHNEFRSLKLDEAFNHNGKWLHELYFANCFDPHSELFMDSLAYMRLQRDFGTFEDWQKDFMACAATAGNGWAVCAFNTHLQRYVNVVISHNSGDVMLGLHPIISLDMWEHSYARDYGTDKKSYLVAMMRELNWNVVEERFQKAEAIAEALK